MSRSPLGVTSDILGLKTLIVDAIESLNRGAELSSSKRKSLSEFLHHYIQANQAHNLKPNGILKGRRALQNIAASVVRKEAGGREAELLCAIDKFEVDGSGIDGRDLLVEYFSRVNTALARSRIGIPTSRYL
jgi:hypothetical protein